MKHRVIIYGIVILALCLLGGKRKPTKLQLYMTKVELCRRADTNGIFRETSRAKRGQTAIKQLGIAMDEIRSIDWGTENPAHPRSAAEVTVVVGAIMHDMWLEFEGGK